MIFEPGTKVELMRGGEWEGPFVVTDMTGRTPDHLVLSNPANGVLFEEYTDEYSVPYQIRPVLQVSAMPDTPFQRRMARGHELRHGHKQDAVHVSSDGKLWHRILKCCGQTIPESVPTWDETA